MQKCWSSAERKQFMGFFLLIIAKEILPPYFLSVFIVKLLVNLADPFIGFSSNLADIWKLGLVERSGQRKKENTIVKWAEMITATERVWLSQHKENHSLITASLLLTALHAMQPATWQIKRPSKRSVNQPPCQLGVTWTHALLLACLLIWKKHAHNISNRTTTSLSQSKTV